MAGYGEAYEIGTDEYRKYLETLTPMEGARSDAMKDMKKSGEFKDTMSKDVSATDSDRKAASKNILHQLKKSIDSKGRHEVEFLDKKKKKVPQKIAIEVIKKFMTFRRSGDKGKFQAKIAKSYNDMLKALKEDYIIPQNKRDTILDRIDNKMKEMQNG